MLIPRLLITACVIGIAASPVHGSRSGTADGRVITVPYGSHPPWAADIVHFVKAPYPNSLRGKHPVGTGFLRMLLNVKTGTVRKVLIEESSGYAAIDASIVAALQQWKFKPKSMARAGIRSSN